MKPHSITENYYEYSVKTIIINHSWYLSENMHGVVIDVITTHDIAYTHTNDKHMECYK